VNRRRSARDEGGAVAILVALSLVVLCMSGAVAVDLGNVAQLHRHAEYTVDDAAISGADLLEQGTDSLTQIVSATEGYIDENWRNLPTSAWDTCPSIPSGYSAPSGSLENCVTFNGTSTASATAISVEFPPQSVPFTLAVLGGFTSGTVEASASAVIVPGTAPCALCLLGPSGLTLHLNGSGSFNVTDSSGSGNAGIVVDSSSSPAANIIGGAGTITAPSIGVVGTASGSGFQPTPTQGIQPVPDPLGYLMPPTPVTTTIGPNISLNGGNEIIPPGNYNNIAVGGNGTLTLESGTYFITGAFTVGGTGGASVQQAGGVLLYFTCSSGGQIVACASGGQAGGSLSLGGTGSMNFSPMTTGPYANLTVFQDRNDNAGMSLSGTPGLSLNGTLYAKDAALALNGTGGTIDSLIVVNSASISGHGSVTVNYDASQNVTLPGAPYLCSLTANNC
jgi:Flp pilus assembly protein TadG